MPAKRLAGKTALVTGGSKGIGFHMARACAREGADLILVSRDSDALEAAAARITGEFTEVSATVIPADLSSVDGAVKLWDQVSAMQHPVDILINNAGFGMFGRYPELDTATELAMVRLNVLALTELTRLALPVMLKNGWGRIVNVASTAAFQSVPYFAAYAATKAYVLSYSEALAVELAAGPVKVTALCPGPTETNFAEVAEMKLSRSVGVMEPEPVAEQGVQAMIRGKSLVVPGITNKIMVNLSRFLPRGLITRMAGKAMGSQL